MQSQTIEDLQIVRLAYQEQQVTLAAAQQHERKLQQQAQSLQQEVEQLRAEARKSAQYADLQRQFQEVRVPCIRKLSFFCPSNKSRVHVPLSSHTPAGDRAAVPEAHAAGADGSREGCAAAHDGERDCHGMRAR